MLTPETRRAKLLEDFKTLKVRHPRLEEMQQFLLQAISGYRSYTLLDLYAHGMRNEAVEELISHGRVNTGGKVSPNTAKPLEMRIIA